MISDREMDRIWREQNDSQPLTDIGGYGRIELFGRSVWKAAWETLMLRVPQPAERGEK